jgi:ribosomal protein S18 acetylase RimI-like enzyme
MEIRLYHERDFDRVDALWHAAFPDDPVWNRASYAIPAKLAFQPELLFVAVDCDQVVGTIMAGYDGHRGWLYAVAVHQQYRRSGLGTTLVRRAETALASLGCVKVNLQVRSTNQTVVQFYQRLGYAVEDRTSLGRRIAGDDSEQ